MRNSTSESLFSAALAATVLSVATFGADVPKTSSTPSIVGPIVDVTLKNGESTKGQLLAIADGNVSLKLDNGMIVKRESDEVVSVRFILAERSMNPADRAAHLTAQETELTFSEFEKLRDFRMREGALKGNGTGPKVAAAPLSDVEKAEHVRLIAKADTHIEVLKREIPDVKTEDAARSKLIELGRYGMLCGHSFLSLKATLEGAAAKIKDEGIRKSVVSLNVMESIGKAVSERKNGFIGSEKKLDKRFGPPPTDHPPGERPPGERPPPAQPGQPEKSPASPK